LYEAVNAKLDKTIEMLGQEVVQKRIEQIQQLQKIAEDTCQESAIFPCSSEGVPQHEEAEKNCYSVDEGCGYQCIDRTFAALDKT
jgi:recombinational DNA repair ATPase RecF